jgi:hypothetical protein
MVTPKSLNVSSARADDDDYAVHELRFKMHLNGLGDAVNSHVACRHHVVSDAIGGQRG